MIFEFDVEQELVCPFISWLGVNEGLKMNSHRIVMYSRSNTVFRDSSIES